MSKNPKNKKLIHKTIKISQAIEGYTSTNASKQKAKKLMEKYAIKVSAKK